MCQPEKTRLLEQIAAIPAMEQGKLSPHSSGRHYKPQCWQGGQNHIRHVPADELPAVQNAPAGSSALWEPAGVRKDLGDVCAVRPFPQKGPAAGKIIFRGAEIL